MIPDSKEYFGGYKDLGYSRRAWISSLSIASCICAQAELSVVDILDTQEPVSQRLAISRYLMFSRLSQLARHFSRPLPNYAHRSAAAVSASTKMTSPLQSSSTAKQIHTAGCIIIGDEVLGGSKYNSSSITN